MTKRLLLPLAAGLALFGATAFIPAPASAHWASAPAAATHGQAQSVSDVVEVQRRRHGWRHHHWPRRHFARPYFYSPYAYYPRRCGYVWSHRYHRHVYRCW